MTENIVPIEKIEELHIELGYQCNIRCTMCYQKDYTICIDPVVWREKLAGIYPTVKKIIIQGGEPTVIKDTKELIELALSKNPEVKVSFMTNGLAFDSYWQNLFVKHGDFVNFSLNAADKDTHEKINRYSKWDKVIDNLKNTLALRKSTNSPLQVTISFVILPDNIKQLSDYIELGKNLGVDKVRFFFDACNLDKDSKLVEQEVGKALDTAKKYEGNLIVEGLLHFYEFYCQKIGVKNIFIDQKEKMACGMCRLPWTNIFVDHFGNLMFCCMTNLVLGNLLKEDLSAIFNNSKAVDFREKILKNNYVYCMSNCTRNPNPVYKFDLVRVKYYAKNFFTYLKRDPKVAWQKAKRKIKQWF